MSVGNRPEAAGAYRPEIDGLRAVAVLAVMLYHAGFSLFAGGYVGVDIFFVISGYLITGIVVRECSEGRFSLATFWERRARRIMPALTFILIVCLPFAWWFMPPAALTAFSKSLFASSLFSGNFYFWRLEGGYFADDSGQIPLLHLWSLAVEEQFYLLFPSCVYLIFRFARRALRPAIIAVLLISLALCAVAGHVAPSANFFLIPTRAWELLAGAALSLWPSRRDAFATRGGASDALALFGVALVVVPMFLLDDTSGFPWPWALPAVVGTVLLLAFATPRTAVGWILASRPFVAIGLISYSAYLWHQPVLAFARLISLNTPGTASLIGLLLLSLGLATLTYHWVEKPFRRRSFLSQRTIFGATLVAALTMAAIGAVGWSGAGFPGRLPAPIAALAQARQAGLERLEACNDTSGARPPCQAGKAGRVTIALFGDSHAEALIPAVDALMNAAGRRAVMLTRPNCPPADDVGVMPNRDAGCVRFTHAAVKTILATPEIDTVILAARWPLALEGSYFDNGEGGVETGPRITAPTEQQRRQLANGYRATVARLLAAGKRIFVIYPIPEVGWSTPDYLVKLNRLGLPVVGPTTSYARYKQRQAREIALLDSLGQNPRLIRIYPDRALCGIVRAGRCETVVGGTSLYIDDDHLSAKGAQMALASLTPAALDRR